MTCNCIADFNEKLAPEHELDTSLTISRGSAPEMALTTYTPLIRKDTRKPERRISKPRLAIHAYCPFCGTSLTTPKNAVSVEGNANG